MTRILQWLLTVLAVAAIDARVWAYDVFSSSLSYELGFYGLYPTANFKTSELAAPLLSFSTWDEQKCSDGYYLFALKGKLVSDTAATIFDSHAPRAAITDMAAELTTCWIPRTSCTGNSMR
ncbi:hypothetical protein NPX13_g5681 [Xylaria arbuscula]|uniref:Uncharacterized protein n=1 Tax=Xylaria arbuscula TaxID=114810 RepID=A0A9W8NDN8_9PEZI|nr:hypothetical protein NPX13_g5681 [Xylaria arbuscula]